MKGTVSFPLSTKLAYTYLLLAAILIPWTIYLGLSLPRHHLSAHWDVSWTGLDIGLSAMLLLTAILAYKRSIWVILTAASTGALLIVDAWFDVLSERNGTQFHEALLFAFLAEVPLAIINYAVAFRVLKHLQH